MRKCITNSAGLRDVGLEFHCILDRVNYLTKSL